MRFEFAAQSAQDGDNRAANTARLINWYREPVGDGGIYLKSALGMTEFDHVDASLAPATLGAVSEAVSAASRMSHVAVYGGEVFGLTGGWRSLGLVEEGPNAGISTNNGIITIVSGGKYYTNSPDTGPSPSPVGVLAEPDTGAFSSFGSVEFLGQLTLLTEQFGRRIQWSDLADPSTLGGLSFATAESNDEEIVRGVVLGPKYMVFKTTVTETWYQSGGDMVAMQGGVIDIGLMAYDLVAKVPQGLFFIGSDGCAYLMAGGLAKVSTPAVDAAISEGALDTVFFFQDEGHKFCVIRFIDRPAWVYDMSTGEWWERSENGGAWSARMATGGDVVWADEGKSFSLTRSNADNGSPLIRTAISRTFQKEGKPFIIPQIELQGRVGWSSDDPQLVFEMSQDGGASYRLERQQGFGAIGQHDRRLVFRALGQYRRATMKVTVSDPIEVTLSAVAFV